MREIKSILLAAGAVLALSTSAQAADLPTKKGTSLPVVTNCFASFWTWVDSTPTDCPLSYWGVTFYGQIDVAGGYNTHASGFNPSYNNGVFNAISATSHNGAYQLIPNGLSQSNIGVKWKERIASNWYFIGDVDFGFDPYSLRFADGPNSLEQNNTLPAFARNTNADSSRAYGPINWLAYAGIENQAFGTLTYGRQGPFSGENIVHYDPFGVSYAFSLIGTSGRIGSGFGDSELGRYTNSIKYVYAVGSVRAGVLSQVGGWSAGNNAQYAIQGDVGFDFYGLSVDGVYEYAKDAVALSTYGSMPVAPLASNTLKATIENLSAFQIAAKYKWQQLTIYGGYQNGRSTNPSDLPVSASIATSPVSAFNDGYPAVYGTAVQGANSFAVAKILQVLWIGGKYPLLPNLDLAAGYYRFWQNDYLGSTETFAGASASCAPNTGTNPLGGKLYGTNNGKCRGVENAVSGMLDWRPWKRFDVYGGVMYSSISGGLASGYFANNNVETLAGVRVSF
jgi:predicted porin